MARGEVAVSLAESVIAINLKRIRAAIAEACARAGRDPSAARLLAVSKTKPLDAIAAASAAGQLEFGENYASEAAEKIEHFPELRFHFIGQLQRNKAKLIVARGATLIHSVDRMSLAREIDSLARVREKSQNVLLQIRAGDEQSKGGASFDEAAALIDAFAVPADGFGIRLCGVMCMPPLEADPIKSRAHFARTRKIFEQLRASIPSQSVAHFSELSMGTTHDFSEAIAEGSTIVRIGSAIFGERE